MAFLGIVVPADFILLKEANSVDPTKRSHQRLEPTLAELYGMIAVMARLPRLPDEFAAEIGRQTAASSSKYPNRHAC